MGKARERREIRVGKTRVMLRSRMFNEGCWFALAFRERAMNTIYLDDIHA